jgi:peptidoglycan/xylan/chitin deacetylase (PgdA/CDA1 family)
VKDHRCLTDEKFVAVTFDDGYADNLQVALPILERFQVPFCVYVTKQFIEQGHKCYTFLDQLQLLSLSHHPLCSIGCHTCSHPHLASLSVQEQKEEIAVCRDWLQQLIGTEVWHLAYPYGSYNADTLLLSDELGFRTAVAAWGGGLRKGVAYPLMAIPRCLVTENAVE